MPIVVQHSPTALQAQLAQNIGTFNTQGTQQQRAIQQAGFLLDQNRANAQLQLQQQSQANEMQRFNQQLSQTAQQADLNRQFQANQSQNELGARLSQEQAQRDFQSQQQQNQLGYDVGRGNQQDQLQRDLEQTRLASEQQRQQNLFDQQQMLQTGRFQNASGIAAGKDQAAEAQRQAAHAAIDQIPDIGDTDRAMLHAKIDAGSKNPTATPTAGQLADQFQTNQDNRFTLQNNAQTFSGGQNDLNRAARVTAQGDINTREGQRTASSQALRLQQQITGIYDPKINYLNSQLHQLTAQLRTVFESGKRDALLGQIAQVSDQLRQTADAKSAAIQAIGQQDVGQPPQAGAPTSQPASQPSAGGGQLWSQALGRYVDPAEIQQTAGATGKPVQQVLMDMGIDPNDVR